MPKNKIVLWIVCMAVFSIRQLPAQDSTFHAKHRAIIFPYPMYTEKWRSSLGVTVITTPEDITEEVRIRVPAGDFHVIRKVTDKLQLQGRLIFQILQNHASLGLHWVVPLNKHFYFSVGNDVGYWFGFLKIDEFNSTGSGWLNYTSASLGWMTSKDLLVTLKAQADVNLFYKASNGNELVSSGKSFYNGSTITLALEQPFYRNHHLTLSFSAIYNYFYWQTWALFYNPDRKVFYPQITIGFIL